MRRERGSGSIYKAYSLYKGEKHPMMKATIAGYNKCISLKRYNDEEAKKIAEDYLTEMRQKLKDGSILPKNKTPSKKQTICEKAIPEPKEIPLKEEPKEEVKWEVDTSENGNFKPNESYTMAVIGSTKSGKTTFLNYLVGKIRKQFDLIVLFSNSAHNKIYDEIEGYKNVITFSSFKEKVVKDLYKFNKKTGNMFKFLLILDDEIDNKESRILKKMFTIYRNSGISTIFSGQDYTFINRASRNNINYVFLLKQNSSEAIDKVVDVFLDGIIPVPKNVKKIEYLKDYYIKNTKDHQIIVLDILNDFNLKLFKVKI